MIPVPRAGIYQTACGVDDAAAIADEVTITAKEGQRVLPLPEGNTYLGFLFAYGETALSVENRLRRAHEALTFEIAEMLPVVVGRQSERQGDDALHRMDSGTIEPQIPQRT